MTGLTEIVQEFLGPATVLGGTAAFTCALWEVYKKQLCPGDAVNYPSMRLRMGIAKHVDIRDLGMDHHEMIEKYPVLSMYADS